MVLLLHITRHNYVILGQNKSAIKIHMHSDGLNKETVQLASQLALFSCPHNPIFIPHYTHMMSGYLWPQSRQQNFMTNSRTTVSAPLSEIPMIVEDEVTIPEGGKVNCEAYDIDETNSKIDLLRFEFHAGPSEYHKLFSKESASIREMTTVVKSSVASIETRKIIPNLKTEPKTDGDKKSAFKFDYIILILPQFTIVLLAMSFVVFCFTFQIGKKYSRC